MSPCLYRLAPAWDTFPLICVLSTLTCWPDHGDLHIHLGGEGPSTKIFLTESRAGGGLCVGFAFSAPDCLLLRCDQGLQHRRVHAKHRIFFPRFPLLCLDHHPA